jgi:hypothetical protein
MALKLIGWSMGTVTLTYEVEEAKERRRLLLQSWALRSGGNAGEFVPTSAALRQDPAIGWCGEQAVQESFGRCLIAPLLEDDVEHPTVRSDRTPKIKRPPPNTQVHFIKMPAVTRHWASTPDFRGKAWPKLQTPASTRLVRDAATAQGEHLFHIPVADRESVVYVDGVADDGRGEAMTEIPR